jgi:hypothetical protein
LICKFADVDLEVARDFEIEIEIEIEIQIQIQNINQQIKNKSETNQNEFKLRLQNKIKIKQKQKNKKTKKKQATTNSKTKQTTRTWNTCTLGIQNCHCQYTNEQYTHNLCVSSHFSIVNLNVKRLLSMISRPIVIFTYLLMIQQFMSTNH